MKQVSKEADITLEDVAKFSIKSVPWKTLIKLVVLLSSRRFDIVNSTLVAVALIS